jgi:ABC-type cobalamin/Fe3+-siderophores transport system ATPase subunit
MSALSATSVSVSIADKTVLHPIDLELAAGQFIALIGPNGAGKTTLLRVLSGLLRPSLGRVALDGTPISSLDAMTRARRIGFLAPSRVAVPHEFRVVEVVGFSRFAHRPWWRTTGRSDPSVHRALEVFELEALADRRLSEISDGQRQRVWLACLEAQATEVLLVDEPTAHLDVRRVAETLATMRRWASEGRAVISVIHDIDAAVAAADRVIVLDGGRVVADRGAPELDVEVLATAFRVELQTTLIDRRTRIVVADYEAM